MIKKILLDTDIGDEIDDTLALYFAMVQGIEIVGVTTVFKNTDERARITKRLMKLYGQGYESIPVLIYAMVTVKSAVNTSPSARPSLEFMPDGVSMAILLAERLLQKSIILPISLLFSILP